jgi:hypothetical protein
LKTVKGLFLLVPSRTPRSSGYDVYAHVIYVVIWMDLSTCLTYTVLFEEQEYQKIETRLIDEKFGSVMGECGI